MNRLLFVLLVGLAACDNVAAPPPPGSLTLGHERYTRTNDLFFWEHEPDYARPASAWRYGHVETTALDPAELPHGAHLRTFAIRCQLDDMNGGIGDCQSDLYVIPRDGSPMELVVKLAMNATAVPHGIWNTTETTVEHRVNWSRYTYEVWTRLLIASLATGPGDVDNVHYAWSRIEWR